MPHRDDLAAARAHVEALQRRVAELESGNLDAPEVAALRAERDRLALEVEHLQASLDGDRPTPPVPVPIAPSDAPVPDRTHLLSLYEHNRSFPQWRGLKGASVLCPVCADAGLRVEMVTSVRPVRASDSEANAAADQTAGVSCPRCGLLGMKRLA